MLKKKGGGGNIKEKKENKGGIIGSCPHVPVRGWQLKKLPV
jgi:hypothetical protein